MPELAAVIRTARAISDLNAIAFVGTPTEIDQARELVENLDTRPRQVFIEALILEVDYLDSLSLSVDWATSFGGGAVNGAQAFQSASNVLGQALSTTNLTTAPPTLPIFPTNKLAFPAYSAGIIGTHLTHHGMHFSTFGAFVQAVHSNSKVDILASPRVITLENNLAELYNGTVDRYKTQSIPNDLGTLITNNYEYLDVGITLRVKPLVTENGIITLDVVEERTAPTPLLTNLFTSNSTGANDFNLVPVLTKERTIAKIHLPDGFFTVLSGILSDNDIRHVNQIPCLGGIPIIGGICKDTSTTSTKQNVMLFIRAKIVDTMDELEDLTKRQQDVYCEKSKYRRSWNYEIDEGLDHFNLKPADPDEIGCGGCNQ